MRGLASRHWHPTVCPFPCRADVVLNGRSEISEDLLAQFADYGVTVVGISGDISNGEDAILE